MRFAVVTVVCLLVGGLVYGLATGNGTNDQRRGLHDCVHDDDQRVCYDEKDWLVDGN